MSSDTPPINSSVKVKKKNAPLPSLVNPSESSGIKENSPLDPFAEFQKLRLETAEINRTIMKGSPFPIPTADSSNKMLGQLLTELRMMGLEIKEIKENVSVMKKEQKDQKEKLMKLQEDVGGIKLEQNIQNEVLENIEENQQKHQESINKVHLKQKNQKKDLTRITENMIEIRENQKKLQEEVTRSREDIRKRINGKWRDVKDQSKIIQTKFENDIFSVKTRYSNSFTKYKLAVKHQDGYMTSVENHKIVQRSLHQGEEYERREYYIENERLVYAVYYYGREHFKYIHERIGDPDSY